MRSLVQALLIPARFRFGLYRRVMDFETLLQHFGQRAAGGFCITALRHREMRGQAGIVACNGPEVQVVNTGYARNIGHRGADGIQVEAARDVLEEDNPASLSE
jgi:hypothetical protein